MKQLILLTSVLFLIASCGAPKVRLSSKGEKVEVLKRKPDSGDCSVIGKVVGENEEGSADLAQNHARNLVGNKGGNAITFDEEVNNASHFKVYATGYKCK